MSPAMPVAAGRGSALRRASLIATLILCAAAWTVGLELVHFGVLLPVETAKISRGLGHLFRLPLASPLPAGSGGSSTLVLLEDGRRLGPPRSTPEWIRTRGRGSYQHTERAVLFSASDNSDPRSNGRRYELWLDPAPQRPPLAALLLLAGAAALPAVVPGLRGGAVGRFGAGPALLLWFLAAQSVLLLHREQAMGGARAALWTLILAAAAAALAAERAVTRAPLRRLAARLPFALAGAGLFLGMVAAARFFALIRPRVEGVDFYFYLCYARDLAAGHPDISPEVFHYFPGVYVFWRSALALVGPGIPGLQWAVIALVIANALLVALVLRRAGLPWLVGGVGALGYVLLASRLEGFYGDTEPICTLPFLAGLLLWGGKLGAGRGSLARLAVLGAGLGLALFTKQQAGLLALGWLAIVAASLAAPPPRRPLLLATLAVPAAACAALAAGFALDGGTAALLGGMEFFRSYPVRGEPLANLSVAFAHAGAGATLGLLCCVVALTALLLSSRGRMRLSEPRVLLFSFCTLAGSATFVQFLRRPYLHYALLALPALLVAIALLGHELWRRADAATGARPMLRILGAGLVAVLFVGEPSPRSYQAWPLPTVQTVGVERPWREESAVARDLAVMAGRVQRGEDILLLPPRRNELHYVLGTRSVSSPLGYNWTISPETWPRALDTPGLAGVIVLEKDLLDVGDRRSWEANGLDAVVALLPARGFHPDTVLPTMTLWRPSR